MNHLLQADILEAMSSTIPEVHWLPDDDLCDCTFQRIGSWTNPYLGKTLRVRLCCIWAELYKQYPEYVQEVNASYDSNRHEWVNGPQQWDSDEMDMPLAIWYRQEAYKQNRPLSEVRAELSANKHLRPKKGNAPRPPQPTQAEVKDAHQKRMRLMGWY